TPRRASAGSCASSPDASGGPELERQAVHAIAQAGGLRPVVEHVADMAAATRAQHFGALHQQAAIRMLDDGAGQWAPEARPAGAAFELGCRAEQRQRAAGAGKRPLAMLIEQRTGERPLGTRLAKDRVALRPEELLPLCRTAVDREMHRSTGATAGAAEQQQARRSRSCETEESPAIDRLEAHAVSLMIGIIANSYEGIVPLDARVL